MVIECAHCQARFKLADDKLKSEGTKVRCSKCKEIFTVFPPTDEAPAPPSPPASPPVAPPPTPAAPSAPAVSQQTVQTDQIDFGELTLGTPAAPPGEIDFSPAATSSPASSAPPAGGGFELEDIAQSASGDFNAAPAAASTGSGGFSADAFSQTAEPEPGGFGEFNFDNSPSIPLSTASGDSNADFGNFDFDNTTAAPASATPEAGPSSDPFSFDQTASGDFDFGDSPATGVASSSAPETSAKDDFDFSGMSFGDENATQVMKAPSTTPAPTPAPSTTAPTAPPRQDPPEQRTAAPHRPSSEGRAKPLATPLPRPRRHFSLPLGRILAYLAVLLVFGTGGAAVYFYLKPGLFDTRKLIDDLISRTTAPKVEEGQIRIANYSGSFVKGAAGEFFVIRGEATNDFKSPRSGLAVKATLYDEKGAVLRSQVAYCGNPISDEALRKESFKTFESAMANQFGESLANVDVAAGKTLTFTVVFPSLPGTSAFTVELAESSPAAKPQ